MNLFKFLLIIIVFASFFLLLKHYYELEKFKFNFNKNNIPVIEADKKPFKIRPLPKNDNDPLENSCTLNNEC